MDNKGEVIVYKKRTLRSFWDFNKNNPITPVFLTEYKYENYDK